MHRLTVGELIASLRTHSGDDKNTVIIFHDTDGDELEVTDIDAHDVGEAESACICINLA